MRDATWMFLTALRTEQRAMRGNPLLLVNSGILPAVFLAIAVQTARPTAEEATELVIAVMLTALWGTTVWMGGGVLRRERTYGTLARCVCGVWSPYLVLLGKSLGATLTSIAVSVASTLATAAALGVPLGMAQPGWLLAVLPMLVCSGTALGALLSCLFLVTRDGVVWSNALMYPVFVLGGLLIPTQTLPEWLRWVPPLISLSWIKDGLVGAATGGAVAAPLAVAAALTGAYAAVAALAFHRSVTAARQGGTLDLA